MKVAIGCDHGGFTLKSEIEEAVKKWGHDLLDCGADRLVEGDDYPDFARRVAQAIQEGKARRGIIICGSGVGASVAANKFKGIRAALCHDTFSAHQGVEDDDMNVLCLGGRVIGPMLALEVVQRFLEANYSGQERHQRRLNKIIQFEGGK